MKIGNRKLTLGLVGIGVIAAVAVLSILFLERDSGAITAAITATGGTLTTFIGIVVYGYTQEYKQK